MKNITSVIVDRKIKAMKKIIFSFYFLLFTGLCFGQLNNYHVSKYLYPDISRTTFSITPRINFNSRSSLINEKRSELNIYTQVYRSHILNSRKKQCNNYFFLEPGYEAIKFEDDSNKRFHGGLHFNIENRYFFKERRFFEIELYNQTNINQQPFELTPNTVQSFSMASNLSPKIGWGRIENITDGWHAWAILKLLEENGKLNKELTPEEIDQFGFEISKIMNLRNTDFRIENIMEFQTLMEYVVDADIIDKEDYGAIAILRDGFIFEDFTNRNQGATFKFGPELYLQRTNYNLSELNFISYNNFALIAEYENRKAIKNIFQFDQIYTLEGGFWNFKPETQEEFNEFKYVEMDSRLIFGYYFNQRTNLSLAPYFNYRYFFDSEAFNLRTGFNLNATYYVSPRLRYNLSSQINLFQLNDGFELLSDTSNTFLNMSIQYFVR